MTGNQGLPIPCHAPLPQPVVARRGCRRTRRPEPVHDESPSYADHGATGRDGVRRQLAQRKRATVDQLECDRITRKRLVQTSQTGLPSSLGPSPIARKDCRARQAHAPAAPDSMRDHTVAIPNREACPTTVSVITPTTPIPRPTGAPSTTSHRYRHCTPLVQGGLHNRCAQTMVRRSSSIVTPQRVASAVMISNPRLTVTGWHCAVKMTSAIPPAGRCRTRAAADLTHRPR
jgi:hypothetical protein